MYCKGHIKFTKDICNQGEMYGLRKYENYSFSVCR